MSVAVPAPEPKPARLYVSGSRESTRMFRRDWMEALSKVRWWVVPLVFVPLIVFFASRALGAGLAPSGLLLWALAGVLIWMPTEYSLHRWVFHYQPRSRWGQRLHFIMHGVHHDYPNDALRLVMPPSASLPITAAFYLVFSLLLPQAALPAFTAGFLVGYVCYDMIHYAVHHLPSQGRWFAALKRHHMQHHFSDPDRRYGVSTPVYDWVFGTAGR